MKNLIIVLALIVFSGITTGCATTLSDAGRKASNAATTCTDGVNGKTVASFEAERRVQEGNIIGAKRMKEIGEHLVSGNCEIAVKLSKEAMDDAGVKLN